MTKLAELTKQYVRDLTSYCNNYLRRGHLLRIEEVFTFDRTRVENLADAIRDLTVFDDSELCLLTRMLIERRLIYRLSYWQLHFDQMIGLDIKFLRKTLDCDNLYASYAWIPRQVVAQATAAKFRIMYFVHGRNTAYNYAVLRFMFLNGSEASSAVGGIVRLKALKDISTSKKDDEYDNIPLYASSLSYEIATAVRHLRAVQRYMPSEYNTSLNAESTSAPIDHWVVVKHGENAILSTGEQLTVQLAREKMRLAKLRKKRSNKRKRIVSSSSSSSSSSATAADNNDDKAEMNDSTVAKSRRTHSSGYQTAISSQRTASEKTSLNIVADYVESANNVVPESNRPSSPFAEDLISVAILKSNDGQSDKLVYAISHCSKCRT
ncbi:hypothetical protein RF55_12609 [Lasius niger]|uniref:Uncharacterized protein n=1 Tax=Lasius niger TaxID=67767 RepID=A0A0J7N5K3_LASNI|nr:hypothetical protein RF55_12609 [Lasius niger]